MSKYRSRNKIDKGPGGSKFNLIPVDINGHDKPENYPTLIRYLEATNRVRHMTHAQQMKARHEFYKGASVLETAKRSHLSEAIVERLIVINGWEEERDRRQFSSFRNYNSLKDRLSPNTNERHAHYCLAAARVVEF